MTYAAVPALRADKALADELVPRTVLCRPTIRDSVRSPRSVGCWPAWA